jgi:hypothetical protein
MCDEPCPTAVELDNGETIEHEWDGYEWPVEDCPASPADTCQRQTAAPAGEYVARFCWGTGFEGTPPCPATVTGVTCEDVPFMLPAPDGEVAYLVDHGG